MWYNMSMNTLSPTPDRIVPDDDRMHRDIAAYLEEMQQAGADDEALMDMGHTALPPERSTVEPTPEEEEERAKAALASGTVVMKHETGDNGPKWTLSAQRHFDTGFWTAREATEKSGINPDAPDLHDLAP